MDPSHYFYHHHKKLRPQLPRSQKVIIIKTKNMNLNSNSNYSVSVNSSSLEMKHFYNEEKIDTKVINKRSKRRVQFNAVECTVHTIERIEYTEQMKELLWYQPSDCKVFRSNDKTLMKTYRRLMKRMHQTIDVEEMSMLKMQIEQMEDETRGLENYRSLRANLDDKHRRISCCHAVLKEQERQRALYQFQRPRLFDTDFDDWSSQFILDETLIRNCVLDTSMKSKLLAYTLGLSDASYVREMNDEDDHTNDTTETESSTSDDRSLETIFLEEIKEDQAVIVKIPSRCCEVDMIVSPVSSKNVTASSILRNYQSRYLVPSYVPCA
jgi:hypothetical protein